MSVIDPTLDPDRLNRVSEMAVEHYEKTVRLVMRNLYPNGYMAGEAIEPNKIRRLLDMMKVHDRNVAVAYSPAELPGNKARAQRELLDEEELKQEVFAQ